MAANRDMAAFGALSNVLRKSTFLITSKEKPTKLSFCLLCFMGVRFGDYEKTYSTDSVASISAAFVACVVASVSFGFVLVRVASLRHAFYHHIISATLFQRLNVMDLDSYYHNRILRWAGHVARKIGRAHV